MYEGLNGIGTVIVLLCVLCVVIFWGGWELIDWLFIDEAIKSRHLIVPEIKLIINNNRVDTLYIYRH